MRENPMRKNRKFYIGMILNVIEGMLSGFNFFLLYEVMKMLWIGNVNLSSLLRLTLFLGVIFVLRIIVYGIGYTESQIGGAAVSNQLRLFLGDKIKKIPLSRFTQGQTGQYINIITSDVNNYEKILTHTVGDLVKHIAFCVMMILFVGYIWLPGGIILACVELVLIPFLWLTFRVVKKYGTEKNKVSAETVSSIVEYHIAAERVLEQISMVDQDVFLFDDTIRENIRHARPDATDEEIEAACKEANCDTFIRKMEKGYDTPTGENGNLLSGGERQRLSIARAILKNSPILLLDEATASLDIENELAVKKAIANLLKAKKTVVMIAHTLSIVKNADQILVVSDGKIAETGTHDELLIKGGKYAGMWNAEQELST